MTSYVEICDAFDILSNMRYEDIGNPPLVKPERSDNAKMLARHGLSKIASIAEMMFMTHVGAKYWEHCEYSASILPPVYGFGYNSIYDGYGFIELMRMYYSSIEIVGIYRLDYDMLRMNNMKYEILSTPISRFKSCSKRDKFVIVVQADDEKFGIYTKISAEALRIVQEFEINNQKNNMELFIDYCRRVVNGKRV